MGCSSSNSRPQAQTRFPAPAAAAEAISFAGEEHNNAVNVAAAAASSPHAEGYGTSFPLVSTHIRTEDEVSATEATLCSAGHMQIMADSATATEKNNEQVATEIRIDPAASAAFVRAALHEGDEEHEHGATVAS